MEQILNEIQTVKWLLIALISIFGLIFLGIVFIIFKTLNFENKMELFEDFSQEAKNLIDKGQLDDVIEKAKSRIETHPKDKWAHWYLAEAYRDKKDYSKALETLAILQQMAPLWRNKYIDPSIDEIKDILQSTKPEVL